MQEPAELTFAVRNGIDVLEADDFRALGEARIGVVVDGTSVTANGQATERVLADHPDVFLDRIFRVVPGPRFAEGSALGRPSVEASSTPKAIGEFVIDAEQRPLTPEDLQDLNALVFDLQETGCRFAPHAALLGDALDACATAHVALYVLDRPNPLDGLSVEGPSSEPGDDPIFARSSLPMRHGMTIGELARYLKTSNDIDVNLRVVGMTGWERSFWFEHTGQPWIAPLPALKDLTGAALYAGLGVLEDTGLALGADDAEPYRIVTAPWVDGSALAQAISAHELEGVKVIARQNGVRFEVEDLQALSPPYLALAVIQSLRALCPNQWSFVALATRLARQDLIEAIDDQAEELDQLWVPDPDFFEARAQALIY